ncbi:MAG: formyltetrahydrofolate deformylase [Brachymonas sp.]|nr:formyltetrahydrofolate deformylase [Brachymonas sp.]
MNTPRYILTLACPDCKGLVHAASGFVLAHEGNMEEIAQFSDPDSSMFFMRIDFTTPHADLAALREKVAAFAAPHGMQTQLHPARAAVPTILMVSKQGHCLNDLLFRWKSGLLAIDVRAVISNHRDFYQLAASYNVPFHHVVTTKENRATSEKRISEIIECEGAELIVLARYMQVLSDAMCQQYAGRMINIHHSFLPSFKGARPYYQAHERGVKLIGATAHYVTSDLDEGPIIEQDVARVDHSYSVEDLTAIGRDTESQVLARAVKWHSEHRVLLNGSRTVVFK